VSARAQLTIDMTRPTFEPVPIAIVDFAGDRVGADIAGVVRNDLQNSGLFRSISPSSFIQRDVDANSPPRFPDWRQSARPAWWSARSPIPAAASRSTSACGT
jgi:TolB protein